MKHNTDPHLLSSLHHNAQRALGGTAAALALVASGQAPTEAVAAGYEAPPSAERAFELPKPSSLPGYNRLLSAETRQLSIDSTVELRTRYAASQSETWAQSCSAKKVTIDGVVRLSTAAHCFPQLTGDQVGLLKPVAGQPRVVDYGLNAENFIEIGVFDPRQAPNNRQELARVEGISIAPNQDMALLSVVPAPVEPQEVPRTFDQIPALKLASNQEQALPRPIPGQRVALHGVQSANGERQVTGLGRYLGRVRHYLDNGYVQYLDIVGIKPSTIAEDMCLPGNSGSSFVSTGKHGSTYMSGPLSNVTNETWAPALFNNYPLDSKPNDITNEIEGARRWRAIYQAELGVDTSSFKTLCAYTANLPNSINTLSHGFGIEPVKTDQDAVGFISGKGGDPDSSMK